ncbi:hypothetical protein ABW19_dt0208421 [Dactylella cylindrospora]|nr:hypothetical protein ABW19_dt0208421 [Dactylella cylindrospora]
MGGTHMQRPSLALINGVIYAGVASHCDQYNYTGWVFGHEAQNPRIVAVFSTISGDYSIPQDGTISGGGGGAGIWQGGMGLATDRSDRFFFVTANGHAHESQTQSKSGKNPPGTLEECIVSMKIDPDTKKIKPQDFFQPYEYLSLDNADKDLGSSGLTLLDPTVFNAPAIGVNRIAVTGGKNGKIYVVNADDLGGYRMATGGSDSILQAITPPGGSIFAGLGSYPKEGGFIYAASPAYNTIVYSFGRDSTGKPVFTQVGKTDETNAGRVGTGIPTITSMNGQAGTGILWLTDVDNGLRAWNAVPNADGTMTRLTLPPVTYVGKWQRPGFGDGKLYIPGSNGKITCLGAPINLPLTCTALDYGELNIGNTKTLSVKCQANIAITSFKGLIISPGLYFTVSNSSVAGISLAKGQNVTIPVTLDLRTDSGKTFTPGSITSSLRVMTNNGVTGYTSQQPVSLSATIVSETAFLQVQPLEISFGGIIHGSEQQTDGITSSVYIKNIGGAPMTILNYVYTADSLDDIDENTVWTRISAPASGDWWYINDGFEASFPSEGSTIAPGVNVAVELKFQPDHVGDFSTWVAVNTSAGYAAFVMSGVDSTAPVGLLQMLTSEGGTSNNKFYDFGTVYGGSVQKATIIISNIGGSALSITKSKPPGQSELYAIHPGDELRENQMISPGANATGTVAFAPFVRNLVNQDPVTYVDYWVLNTDGYNFDGPYNVEFTGTVITPQVGPLYTNGSARYKYLGCWLDGTNGRLEPNKYTLMGTNENGKCQNQCSSAGYAFALSEYAYECWCGNLVPDSSLKGPDSFCATQCPGDTTQSCGGDGGYASAWYDSARYDPTTNKLDGVVARPPSFQQTAGDFSFYGCWSDSTGSRSLKGKAISSSSVNITWCANYCAGYSWMGTSYSNECYCGNDLGGVSKPLTDCNMLCVADQYSYCGAGSRLSLYIRNGTALPLTTASSVTSKVTETSTTVGPSSTGASGNSNWDYVGCWTDDVADRSLQDLSYAADDNSLAKCSDFCAGFAYLGLEYGSECYCGNSLGGSAADASTCYKACTGSSEICGGDNRLNLYRAKPAATTTVSGSTPTPSLWVDMGCYKDYTGNRTLIGKSTTSTSNTAAWCYNYCNGLGYTFFATEYSNECYCGSAIVGVGVPVSSGCTYKCAGDSTQFCGGSNRMNMYMVNPQNSIYSSSYTSSTSSTVSKTTSYLAATASQSFSTSQSFSSSQETVSSTTSSVVLGPTIVSSHGNFAFYSCWTDRTSNRALAGWGLDPGADMTVEKCIDYCAPNKQYVGVEDGRECWCGNDILSGEAAPNAECMSACGGDSGSACGGPSRLAIYQKVSNNPQSSSATSSATQVASNSVVVSSSSLLSNYISSTTLSSTIASSTNSAVVSGPTYLASHGNFVLQSCWTDRSDNRTLAGWGLDPAPDMTVEKCLDYCSGFNYAGLEFSTECWCGNSILTGDAAPDADCNSPCAGSPDTICGGWARLVLYKKGVVTSSLAAQSSTTGLATSSSLTQTTPSQTTDIASTTVWTNGQYTPSPILPGQVGNCVGWRYTQGSDMCENIVTRFQGAPISLTMENLLAWNPALGPNCENFVLKYYICVQIDPSLPTARPTGSSVVASSTQILSSSTPLQTNLSQTAMSPSTTKGYSSSQGFSSSSTTSKVTTSQLTATTPSSSLVFPSSTTLSTLKLSSMSSSTGSLFSSSSSGTLVTSTSRSSTTQPSSNPTLVATSSSASVANPLPSADPWTYLGCYLDSSGSRTLPNKTTTQTVMTVEYCQKFCMGTYNLPYSGVEASNQCFCSDGIGYGRQPGQTGCTKACAGNADQVCGGSSRLSIYQNTAWKPTVIPGAVLGWTYNGCWTEITGRAIKGYSYSNSTGMTNAQCITTCKGKGYTVAALQNRQECFCSLTNLATVVNDDTQCNGNCVGNATEYCGAANRLQVYLSP